MGYISNESHRIKQEYKEDENHKEKSCLLIKFEKFRGRGREREHVLLKFDV